MTNNRQKLISELNQELLKFCASDLSEYQCPGDIIRGVFFTMMEHKFKSEEILEVFKGVKLTDEKMALIEEMDFPNKRS